MINQWFCDKSRRVKKAFTNIADVDIVTVNEVRNRNVLVININEYYSSDEGIKIHCQIKWTDN